MTLIETLVAVAVLAISLVGIFTATITGSAVSATARLTAQMNTLATGFSETIKSLPYVVCADASRYQDDFNSTDSLGLADEKLQSSLGATLNVVSVNDEGVAASQCPTIDSGAQRVTVEVAAHNRTLRASIVKRNPDPLPRNESITINTPVLRSNLNDVTSLFAVSGVAKLSAGVYLVEWWCNAEDSWASDANYSDAPIADFTSATIDDPTSECTYVSPVSTGDSVADAAAQKRYLLARVTDTTGRVHYSPRYLFDIPLTTRGANPPAAKIYQITEPPCTNALPCTVDVPVTLDGRASVPGDGFRFDKCVWNFGDESPTVVFIGTNCHNQAVTHTFVGQGTFGVTLTVTNNLGNFDVDTRNLVVEGPARRRPHVEVTGWAYDPSGAWSNEASPSTLVTGVAPQHVQFSPAGSYAYDGATIESYSWNFGDTVNEETSGASGISHGYTTSTPSASTQCDGSRGYKVTLTVTDSNNVSNSASMCVVLDDLKAPPGFSYTGRTGLKRQSAFVWYIDLSFQWQTIGMTPGTPSGPDGYWWIEIQIKSSNTASCWLGTETSRVDNPQVVPPASAKGGTVRRSKAGDLFGVIVADLFNTQSCVAEARTVRNYNGLVLRSTWSSPSTKINR